MTSTRVETGFGSAVQIIDGGVKAPPPNANVGASMYIVRNSGEVAVFLGSEDLQEFELPVGAAFTVGPVGPGDELWAVSSVAGRIDILRHDAN